jgi:poly(A) polymerase
LKKSSNSQIIHSFEKDVFNKIAEIAKKRKTEVYLVGGIVRDSLLGIENNDIDICVIGDAIEFATAISEEFNKKLKAIYKRFGTALLELDGNIKIEFASARSESYEKSSRKPKIEYAGLEKDLARRDFTINTLAVSLNGSDFGKIIDIYNGIEDINNKIIRTPLEPSETFDDDPLRILRCIRFASQLNFKISDTTFEGIKQMKNRLRIENDKTGVVSQERITDEFLKTLSTPKPSIGLDLLQKSSVMEIIFPEVASLEGIEQRKEYHHKDVFYHTMQVIDNISINTDNIWLRFAALMHDIAKPFTKKFIENIGWTFHGHEELGAKWQKKIFTRMRIPMDKLPYVEKLIRLHLRPIALAEENVTDSAIRRLIFEAGNEIFDLMTLCRADITSKDPDKIKKYISNFVKVEKRIREVEERDKIRNFQSPVRGEEIMTICNIPPSKNVGLIKKKIEEAILEGIIPNEHEASLKYLLTIKDEILKTKT